jgi:hypothetical protein
LVDCLSINLLKADRKSSPLSVTMAIRSLLVSALAAQASAVWLAGVNIAGCEIGIDTSVRNVVLPSKLSPRANRMIQGNFAPNDFEKQYSCPSTAMAKSQMYETERCNRI